MRISNRSIAALALAGTAILAFTPSLAQPGGGRRPAEYWWVNKTEGGVYKKPMRPLWKLADLKKMHAGQNNWSEQIILDPEQDATYNSAAPGSKFTPRIHPDTPTVFVVVAGEMHFNVEGQQPLVATRGSVVNIMKTTIYSYEVGGGENALWVEVNPANYKTAYPADGPQPEAVRGGKAVKVGFPHRPEPYSGVNTLHYNTFDDGIAKCMPAGPRVVDDHIFVNPLIGYPNPAENKCTTITRGPAAPSKEAFNPRTTFGHMHAGPAEWWVIQAGQISGKFENTGEFHAVEGDVLYAAPMTWHQMGVEGTTGPSIRLAMGGYNLINMQSGAGGD